MGERWADIHGPNAPQGMGASPARHATPVVRTPTCPEHCSGRHTLDSVIACPHCRTAAFQVWSHEYLWSEGHNFHVMVAVNGATLDGPRVFCSCGREFLRK